MHLLLAVLVLSQTPSPSPAAGASPAASLSPAPRPIHEKGLPPNEAAAKTALQASPRHGEWSDLAMAGGTPLRTWTVYPERKEKAAVVIIIHEIYGLTDWVRAVADQLASDGFIAVAPDLLSGRGPGGGGTEAIGSRDEVVKLVRALPESEVNARLDAIRAWAVKLPAANGRSATLGFCWGGARSFGYAVAQPALDAAVVFYGSSPETPTLDRIKAAVLGLYGSDDARVNATVPAAGAEMKRLGKTFLTRTFEGAGHGFLRAQEGRDGANLKASREAWPAVVSFLSQRLK